MQPRRRDLIAALGWAAAAHAGTVIQTYHVDLAFGASGSTQLDDYALAFTATDIKGDLVLAIYSPDTTPPVHSELPELTASIHIIGGGIHGQGYASGMNPSGGAWTITGTVSAHPKSSALCHVGSGGKIAATCSATFSVRTRAHCSGDCTHGAEPDGIPGNWTGKSDTHRQKWSAMVHLGDATFSHTTGSAHYLKSFQAKLTPHTAASSTGHLASSDSGYHTSHIVGKLMSSSGGS